MHSEAGLADRCLGMQLQIRDDRKRRAFTHPCEQSRHGRLVALEDRFDCAIRVVAHPTGHAARLSLAAAGLAIPDPLHLT